MSRMDESSPTNNESHSTLSFLTAIFPESNLEILTALLQSVGDDLAMVVEALIGQEAADHQTPSSEDSHPLDILSSFYPNVSPKIIQSAWIRCNGDVTLAAEHLLNPTQDIPFTSKILPPKSDRGRSEDIVLKVSKKKNKESLKTNEVLVENLAAVFPDQSRELLEQILKETNFDLERAAMKLSQWTVEDCRRETSLIPQTKRDVESLQILFPTRSKETLEDLLQRKGHLEAVVDYLSGIEQPELYSSEVEACNGECIGSGFPCLLHASSSATTRAARQLKQSEKVNQKNIWDGDVCHGLPRVEFYSSPRDSTPNRILSNPIYEGNHDSDRLDEDPSFYRARANDIREQRNHFYKRACEAFKTGGLRGSGAAAYYSQEARKLQRDLESWVQKAVTATIQKNQSRLGKEASDTIDVHGLTVVEAIQYVEQRVNEWFNSQGSKARPAKRLKVITGVGRHSQGGVPRVYPALVKLDLKQKGWELRLELGHFFVLP